MSFIDFFIQLPFLARKAPKYNLGRVLSPCPHSPFPLPPSSPLPIFNLLTTHCQVLLGERWHVVPWPGENREPRAFNVLRNNGQVEGGCVAVTGDDLPLKPLLPRASDGCGKAGSVGRSRSRKTCLMMLIAIRRGELAPSPKGAMRK